MYSSKFNDFLKSYFDDPAFIEIYTRMQLSRAEIDVVKHILCGKTNREISQLTNNSIKTIKFHITGILKKFRKMIKSNLNEEQKIDDIRRSHLISYCLLFYKYKPFISNLTELPTIRLDE